MMPRPLRSTLFPYTTLFRSSPARWAAGARRRPAGARPLAACRGPDRKSTRLNSSHQIISYAVFCLKKKNLHDVFVQRVKDDLVDVVFDLREIHVEDVGRDDA